MLNTSWVAPAARAAAGAAVSAAMASSAPQARVLMRFIDCSLLWVSPIALDGLVDQRHRQRLAHHPAVDGNGLQVVATAQLDRHIRQPQRPGDRLNHPWEHRL